MTKKLIALYLLLIGIAAWTGWKLRQSILQFETENNPAKILPARDVKQTIVPEKTAPKLVPARNYNAAEFAVIPEKNIFSESRSKEERTDSAAPPEPPPLAQKPALVGVTITENQPRALIIDTSSPQQVQGNRRAQTKRIGDVYQGYTITEISLDGMVLESGTRKEVIPLREGTKRTQQGKTPILSTRIVPFGAGGTSGGTPVTVTTGGAPAQTQPQRNAVVIGAPATSINVQPTTVQSSAPPARTTQPSAAPQAKPAPQPPSQGDVRVIKTPFGDIVRPAR